MLAQWLRRFIGNARGNVAVIFALCVIPVTFLVGMGIDYGQAAMRYDQLSSAADSAALAAVTATMMAGNDAASIQAATQTFNAQASTVSGITYNPANVKVTVVDTITTRTVTVSYTAASTNAFPSILGSPTIALGGQSQAVGQSPPNIDFYLLLDTSPSMAIAATQNGIDTMVNATSSQGGCAFACHQTNAAKDNLGNPSKVACTGAGYANPSFPNGGEDNYALARCLNVVLRIDNLNAAAQNLMATAKQTETSNNATYRMATYSFDVAFNTIGPLTSSLALAQTEASNLTMLQVYSNNNLTANTANNDEDTDYDNAMTNINSTMPNPGNGTNAQGDKPQEVMFLVTDGVEDECQPPPINAYNGGGCRQQYLMNSNTDWCTKIKNRGIRIAILYTEYLPLPNNPWYVNFNGNGAGISSFQPNIAAQLQSCASPGLFHTVQTGGDISTALAALFQAAVATAHLSK